MEEEKKKSRFHVPGKWRRRFVRIVAVIIGLYILLLVSLSIYVSSSKERLLGFLNAKMKETILGELKINNADITIWRTFPDIGITLENVTISDSFYHRPFIKAEEITARAGFIGLLGNRLKIGSVTVKNAVLHSFTDANGYSNNYVLMPHKKDTANAGKSKKPIVLKNFNLENVTVVLEDVIRKKRYAGRIDDADVDMRFTGSKYHITFDEDLMLRGLGFNLPQGYWLENQRIQAKWKLIYDTSGVLTINESKVKIQGQPFLIKGEFDFKRKSQFHIDASTKGIEYASALTILKPKTRNRLDKINLTEPVDVNVSLTGPLAKKGDPAVKVDFVTTENNITTPVVNLTNCSFKGNYSNQVDSRIAPNDSNSKIIVTGFTSNWGQIKMSTPTIAITNLSKPTIQFEFNTACTMAQLDETLLSETFDFTEGSAKLYLAYNGPLIPDPSLLNLLNAKIEIENGTMVYVPRNITFSSCNGAIAIAGNTLAMNNFRCNVNASRFTVNINGSDLNRYSKKEAGKASINCSVYSPSVDLNDFKTLFANKGAAKIKKKGGVGSVITSVDDALENGDMHVILKADKVALHNFKATNVNASMLFEDNDWGIQKASLQHADGSFDLSAKVHQVNNNYHQAVVNADLSQINVKKLFYAFDNFGQTSITSGNLQGIMNAKANLAVGVNNAGKLLTNSLNGKLYFSLKNAALTNFKPLLNIQQYVFKNRDLNNVQFAELKDTFDIKNGDVYIRRMPVQSSAITMYIEGVYSTANRTDILIQVPLSSLTNKPGDKDFKKIDRDKLNDPGRSINLRAKDGDDGQIKISLDLFNKYKREKRRKQREKDKE
ncbi:AsmA family protein [Parafilimonas terrae]|uniref:AsmA-like C-terminal region n=1 Tax=Parafilimonas terrae TaxID=1465490 RepID=A0A1I5UVN7_9BACT|nr:AsmA-like C-terminal region-containing protein [Parafilimonas terrae]SFP98776.1 AsmA-like C-terminal region [Parafilimonas terrae]